MPTRETDYLYSYSPICSHNLLAHRNVMCTYRMIDVYYNYLLSCTNNRRRYYRAFRSHDRNSRYRMVIKKEKNNDIVEFCSKRGAYFVCFRTIVLKDGKISIRKHFRQVINDICVKISILYLCTYICTTLIFFTTK